MTPNKAIEIVDRVKLNSYSEEDKLRWINELDGMVKRLVFQWDEAYLKEIETLYKSDKTTEKDKEEYKGIIEKAKPYSYPEDMDTKLLITEPFENVYPLYLEAQIDFHNREYDHYNNTLTMFDGIYTEYKKAYIREHRPRG